LTRTRWRLAAVLTTAALAALAALPATSAARDRAVSHSAARSELAAYVAPAVSWQRAALRPLQVQAARQRARQEAAQDAEQARAARQRALRQARREAAQDAAQARQQAAAQSQQQVATPQPAAQVTAVSAGGSPQAVAQSMLGAYGWSGQWGCLYQLWDRESGWNMYATNPSSGAYGIPQSLPGSKMSSAGPDWQTDAATQIRWGLGYIRATYGSPCAAWAREQSSGWY
jgi:hypothetical protein